MTNLARIVRKEVNFLLKDLSHPDIIPKTDIKQLYLVINKMYADLNRRNIKIKPVKSSVQDILHQNGYLRIIDYGADKPERFYYLKI